MFVGHLIKRRFRNRSSIDFATTDHIELIFYSFRISCVESSVFVTQGKSLIQKDLVYLAAANCVIVDLQYHCYKSHKMQ